MEIPESLITEAKINLCDMDANASKWLCALAIVLIAQHDEDPSGIELNIKGAKLRVVWEGSADDSEDG